MNKKYSWSAVSLGTVAGALGLLLSSPEAVQAQEQNDLSASLEEVQALYNQFKQVKNKQNVVSNKNEEIDKEAEMPIEELNEEYNEELLFIKSILIQALQKAGGQGLVDQLDTENVSVEELDNLFNYALNYLSEERTEGQVKAYDGIATPAEEVDSEEAEEVTESEPVEMAESLADSSNEATEIEPDDSSVSKVQKNEEYAVANYTVPGKDKTKSVISYTVRPGDTLNKIARQFSTKAEHLAQLNQLSDKNVIHVGQILNINDKKALSHSANQSSQTNKKVSSVTSRDEFIQSVGEAAREVAAEYNLYASVMVAQAALESGYGRSGLSLPPNHNLFGIKGHYAGQSVKMPTSEYSKDKGWHRIQADFRKYPSYKESLMDNAKLLRGGTSFNPRFYAGAWRENAASYEEATQWLQGRYATDPTYASKLNNIISLYKLTQFDSNKANEASTGGSGLEIGDILVLPKPNRSERKPNSQAENNLAQKKENKKIYKKPQYKPQNQTNRQGQYQIQSGDTLYLIAQKFNTTVDQLKVKNNLTSDLIITGHYLKVPKMKSSQATVKKPSPKLTNPVKTQKQSSQYIVQKGDTLLQIARQCGLTVDQLVQLNNLSDPNIIHIGQKLITGSLSQKSSVIKQLTKTSIPKRKASTVGSYTVKPGDTLYSIAGQLGVKVSDLIRLNGLSNPNLIHVGQPLRVRSGQGQWSKQTYPRQIRSQSRVYTVKSGDTLYTIAQKLGTTVDALAKKNQLKDSNLIYINQELTY